MSDDWKPGDLALCVNGQVGCEPPLETGSVHTVAEVGWGISEHGEYQLILVLDGIPRIRWGGRYWDAHDAWRFRKIKPLTDEERNEALQELRTPERVS